MHAENGEMVIHQHKWLIHQFKTFFAQTDDTHRSPFSELRDTRSKGIGSRSARMECCCVFIAVQSEQGPPPLKPYPPARSIFLFKKRKGCSLLWQAGSSPLQQMPKLNTAFQARGAPNAALAACQLGEWGDTRVRLLPSTLKRQEAPPQLTKQRFPPSTCNVFRHFTPQGFHFAMHAINVWRKSARLSDALQTHEVGARTLAALGLPEKQCIFAHQHCTCQLGLLK